MNKNYLIESLTSYMGRLDEARNPENDEVNSIIKKHLGKKSHISKKEQEILDKYGISRDEYGRFKGKNGELLSKSSTTVYGPRKSNGGYGIKRDWDLSKGYNNPNYQETADSFDNVDFANYLNKDHGDTSVADRAIYNRRKNRWWDYDSTQAENDALRPYSDEYKVLKDNEANKKDWVDWYRKTYPYDSDEDVEKKVAEYKQKLLRDRDYNKQRIDRSQADYDKASKELNDFRDSIKAKQAAKKKNESLALEEGRRDPFNAGTTDAQRLQSALSNAIVLVLRDYDCLNISESDLRNLLDDFLDEFYTDLRTVL